MLHLFLESAQDKKEGGDLFTHCRHQLKHRKRPVGKQYPIANRVSIDERPRIVNKKVDLVIGKWTQ